MRKLLVLSILLFTTTFTFADDSGYGCMIGEHWVYTVPMGTSKVNGWDNTQYKYFKFSGHKIPIYPGYGLNLHRGYRCGYINRFGASSYYDSTIPPYGGMVAIPAEQEYTLQGSACVVSNTLGGAPMGASGQSGVGQYVYYTYNRSNMCGGGGQTNVPLDDYAWVLVLGAGAMAVFLLKRHI
ncbi:MAG: hypothetical protein EOO90_06040 [Pedobacter sp.]|nr:MAG: hypothetical protein EOO90_06040 [Pedobacter sp.]